MAMEIDQDYQLDGELVLHDVIDIVCKYLDGRDLNIMTQVCKSWRHAALREKDKRHYMQYLCFPYNSNNLTDTLLEVNPCVSLLIYDTSLENSLSLPLELQGLTSMYPSNGLEEELLEDFINHLPNTTVVLRAEDYITTDDVGERHSLQEQSDYLERRIGSCNILGLFLPNVENRVRVRVSSIKLNHDNMYYPCGPYSYDEICAFRLAVDVQLQRDLCLDEWESPKSTILCIGNLCKFPKLNLALRDCIFELCKRAHENGQDITLANFFGTKLVQADRYSHSEQKWRNRQLAVILRISGPGVESWSTYIFCFAPHDEVERKLRRLKERVRRKRQCIGLISAAKCRREGCSHINHPCGNSHGMMVRLKHFFPGIRFVGSFPNLNIYLRHPLENYDIERGTFLGKGISLDFNFENYVSIVIISYD